MKRVTLCCVVAGCVFLADLTSRPGLSEGRWTHPAAENGSERADVHHTPQTRPLKGRSSSAARADSLQHRVEAGSVLIITLPERVADHPVVEYEMLRAPALSNLAGRSFFWRTRPRDEGRHRLLFRARFDTTGAGDALAADTLALLVTVEETS